MVDTIKWKDFEPNAANPYQGDVWVGYDPSLYGDSAGLAVIAPPTIQFNKFRVFETHQFKGLDFEKQAQKILEIKNKYKVTKINIDVTGIGQGVFQLVQKFFPLANPIHYNINVKTNLVLKAIEVFRNNRLEFDQDNKTLARAFMSIKKTLTDSQRAYTFKSDRNAEISHSDIAWAVMHALSNERIGDNCTQNTSKLEFF